MNYRFQEDGSNEWHYMPAPNFRTLLKKIKAAGFVPILLRIQVNANQQWIDCGKVEVQGVRHIPTNQTYPSIAAAARAVNTHPGTLWSRIKRSKYKHQDWQIIGA